MRRGREILLPQNRDHQARMILLRVNPHPLFLVLCLNNLLHLHLHHHSHHHNRHSHRNRSLKLNSLLDRRVHTYMAIILAIHTTPSRLRTKAFRLGRFLSRTLQMSKMGSSERLAMERTLVRLRSWSHHRSDPDIAASAVRRTARARAAACTATNRARIVGKEIARAGTAGVRTRCVLRPGIRSLE